MNSVKSDLYTSSNTHETEITFPSASFENPKELESKVQETAIPSNKFRLNVLFMSVFFVQLETTTNIRMNRKLIKDFFMIRLLQFYP